MPADAAKPTPAASQAQSVPTPHAAALVLALLVAASWTGGCASRPAALATTTPGPVVIGETYESSRFRGDNIDSLAVWAPGGWVLATAKSTDSVLVLKATDGAVVDRIAGCGQGRRELRRPNGIAVVDDLLLVVERDNHRVQVIKLPGLDPLGLVGSEVLRLPYGIAAYASAPGRYELLVTDSYQQPDGSVPPDDRLGERVKHFRLELEGGVLRSSLVRSFGATSGAGVLHVVESIAVDAVHNRLLIADEAPGQHDIKIYDLGGVFTGERLGQGMFRAEPEGIALLARGDDGYWVTTDQQKARTVFYLFDRRTLRLAGAFTGRVVANTDGIVVASGALEGFPEGALFAVHDDASVAAFAWPAIAGALSLPPRAGGDTSSRAAEHAGGGTPASGR